MLTVRVLPINLISIGLGILYFQHGSSAQALRLYEVLKEHNDPCAEELIAHYGAALGDAFAEA